MNRLLIALAVVIGVIAFTAYTAFQPPRQAADQYTPPRTAQPGSAGPAPETITENLDNLRAARQERGLKRPGSRDPGSSAVGPADRVSEVVAPSLISALKRLQAASAQGTLAAMNHGPFVRSDEAGRLQVYVHVTEPGDGQLRELGDEGFVLETINPNLSIAQGWVPFERLEHVAALSFVTRIEPPGYSHVKQGDTITEGDMVHLADVLRGLGLDGSGVRIGVISDGANNRNESQAAGELPGRVVNFGICNTREADPANCLRSSSCNEGTAILEIIHDMAPGAALAVAASGTSLEFVDRVHDLINFGADVIIDDIGYFGEPYFADGPVAAGIAAIANDVVFVSSAGNGANDHFEADYRSRVITVFGDTTLDAHDFDPGATVDTDLDITIPPDQYVLVFMQWNDEFGSSRNDYDLALTDSNREDLLCDRCVSAAEQSGFGDDPFEAICYHNDTEADVTGKLIINRFDGAARRFEVFMLGRNLTLEHVTPEGSVFGHAGVPGVLAVGAINFGDAGHDEAADYSARGPSRIDFPSRQDRAKPDLIAIDGVSVTGTGGFPSEFFGTSASAPHVAAIAGLLRQASPAASVATIRNALTAGTVDLGPTGFDNTYGAGRLDGVGALGILVPGYASDRDSDGVIDIADAFPDDPNEFRDTDGDGTGDQADTDDDNDGYDDLVDAFPLIPEEHSDLDGNGVGDTSDSRLESEGNNSRSDANPILATVIANLDATDDEDWFSVIITEPTTLLLELTPETAGANDHWVFLVSYANGNVRARSDTLESATLLAGVDVGTWYIRVYVDKAWLHRDENYELTVERTAGFDLVESEPNNTLSQASHLSKGVTQGQLQDPVDIDWYRVDVGSSTSLTANLDVTPIHPDNRWTFSLRTPGGSTLAVAELPDDGELNANVDAGPWYLVIESQGGTPQHVYTPYTISISCGAAALDRDCDGIADSLDHFPDDALEQTDNDGDGVGDNRDPDDDNDGLADDVDPQPLVADSGADGRLGNISTRGAVGSGDHVLIGGLIIEGTETKDVIIRARGESMIDADPNLNGLLADPVVQLFAGASLIASNNNWMDDPQAPAIPNGLQPTRVNESALFVTLDPGAYTAIVSGVNESAGLGIVEVIEITDTGETRLSNISTRGFVGAGDDVLIGGVIIGGGAAQKVTIRARGTSITSADPNLAGDVLADPMLQLFDATGTQIDSNDNWGNHSSANQIRVGLAPEDPTESAITRVLLPGAYTAIVRGAGGSTGIAIIEVFEID